MQTSYQENKPIAHNILLNCQVHINFVLVVKTQHSLIYILYEFLTYANEKQFGFFKFVRFKFVSVQNVLINPYFVYSESKLCSKYILIQHILHTVFTNVLATLKQ